MVESVKVSTCKASVALGKAYRTVENGLATTTILQHVGCANLRASKHVTLRSARARDRASAGLTVAVAIVVAVIATGTGTAAHSGNGSPFLLRRTPTPTRLRRRNTPLPC